MTPRAAQAWPAPYQPSSLSAQPWGGDPLILTPCLGFPDGLRWRRRSLPVALPPPVLLMGANSRCSRSRRGGPQVPYDAPTAVRSSASSRWTRPGPCSSLWGARVTRQVGGRHGVTEMQSFRHRCYGFLGTRSLKRSCVSCMQMRRPSALQSTWHISRFQVGPENSCFG